MINKDTSRQRTIAMRQTRAIEGGNGMVLKPYEPDWADAWYDRSKENMISNVTYELADGVWVTAQSLISGPNTRHINGSVVAGNERVDAFVNTVEWGTAFVVAPTNLSSFSSGPSNGVILRNQLGDALMYIDRGRITRYGYRYSIKYNNSPFKGYKELWKHLWDW